MTSQEKNWCDLPVELERAIFLCLSLQDRISMRIICHHWKDIIEDTFLLVRSLKLFDSYRLLSTYYCPLLLKRNLENDPNLTLNSSSSESDDLVLHGSRKFYKFRDFVARTLLDLEHIDRADRVIPEGHFLVNLFPNVEKLVVCFSHVPSRIDVFHLLTHYAPQLTSLGVFKESSCNRKSKDENRNAFPFDELSNLIGSMQNLTSLYLGRNIGFITRTNLEEPKLWTLEKLSLEQIYKNATDFLLHHSSPNLKHINVVTFEGDTENVFDTLGNRNVLLARQLESLAINFFWFDEFLITEVVESICSHFVALESLHLNLENDRSPNEVTEEEYKNQRKFIFTQFARLNNLTSKFFNISLADLGTIPIMKNIQNVTIELSNVANCNVDMLERFLLVIFPNAVRIVLRCAYYRWDTRWEEGSRDRLEQLALRNGPLVQLDRNEEFEQNLVPLLGRHAEHFRGDDELRPYFEDYIPLHDTDESSDNSDSDESEVEDQSDSEDVLEEKFMGVSVEVLTLLYDGVDGRFDDFYRADDKLKMLMAFKRIVEKNHKDNKDQEILSCSFVKAILDKIDVILIAEATDDRERVLCLRSIDFVRYLASLPKKSIPNNFAESAKSWIAILLLYFGHKNVSQNGFTRMCEFSLNLALDEIYKTTTIDVMLSQIGQPLKHQSASVRKATAHFIYRALNLVDVPRLVEYAYCMPYRLDKSELKKHKSDYIKFYRQLDVLLKKAIKAPNETEEIRNLLRLALLELDEISRMYSIVQ